MPESLAAPAAILFDWHGTLVDTVDAMYRAIDALFPRLAELGLLDRLLDPRHSRSEVDAELLSYVRAHKELDPKVKAARRISRTDIFEVLFGPDKEAKAAAHQVYDECYRAECGVVRAYEPGIRNSLLRFKERGLGLGIVTNRNREFLSQELAVIEGGQWQGLFDVVICGDDTPERKPIALGVLRAVEQLGYAGTPRSCWNVGDSSADVIAAQRAGTTAIFYNGARWSASLLKKMFPGSRDFPEVPHAFVQSFAELERLSVTLRAESGRLQATR